MRLRSLTKSTLAYNLSAPDDGFNLIGWLSSGTGCATRDLDEPGEDASADAFILAAVRFDAALDEFDLTRVEGGANLGHKSTVERIGRAARGRRRPVQHAGKRIGSVEDVDNGRGNPFVVASVQDRGECGHVVVHDCMPHFGGARLGRC